MPILGSIPFGLTEGSGASGGSDVAWSDVDSLFPEGTAVTVTDYITGKSFSVKRTGGTNHAVVKPVSSTDEQTYLEVFGGTTNWSKSAAVVLVRQARLRFHVRMPRGDGAWSSASGLSGGFDLYFSGSTSILGIFRTPSTWLTLKRLPSPERSFFPFRFIKRRQEHRSKEKRHRKSAPGAFGPLLIYSGSGTQRWATPRRCRR
jgi:hypothetical protein